MNFGLMASREKERCTELAGERRQTVLSSEQVKAGLETLTACYAIPLSQEVASRLVKSGFLHKKEGLSERPDITVKTVFHVFSCFHMNRKLYLHMWCKWISHICALSLTSVFMKWIKTDPLCLKLNNTEEFKYTLSSQYASLMSILNLHNTP